LPVLRIEPLVLYSAFERLVHFELAGS
jgi:hypothetical protein